jgi:GxxExxY protein
MSTDKDKLLYRELTFKIIGLAMEVHNDLGSGFLEKVYENALMVQFKNNNIKALQQFPIKVLFRGEIIGDYVVDIFVENKILIELKSIEKLADIHKAQVINYLKATEQKIALLINFGRKKLEYERIIYG